MNITIIPSAERGLTQTDWLESKHSFSFGTYYALKRLNFGTLRVFNDDVIAPGKGFSTHAHQNMEIVTIVIEGALQHKDSVGHDGLINAGDVQRMTAGKGIQHSEFNPSKQDKVRLLQIWIYPDKRDLEPGYEQKTFNFDNFRNAFVKIVSPVSSETSIFIHQDATFYMGSFDPSQTIQQKLRSSKYGVYLFVIEGEISLEDKILNTGDSAQITKTDLIEMKTHKSSKILLIEVHLNTL